ncbi:MAG: alpha/beta hydrolase [Colwellia polaris]|jgi:esterase/lipase superfamily enzyme|uniref:alpha/beta hydrolase n=1 Tax=Colwellia polaris TaxID=326537 RepID=UPI000A16F43D|nr:alpha/beta hydrolase [Colwellia polaris]|tara:strand:+ start:11037 stop:12164 length:1128 start_codon:yes stop_codon:yes gene_type:complete
MLTLTLYYATNRNHIGERWSPDSYGQDFSSDRANNLRFGKVCVEVSANKVKEYLNSTVDKRSGDGESLAGYIEKKLRKKHLITAFEEPKNLADVTTTQLPSVKVFQALKKQMETKQDLVIFIHGFNVDWFEAVASALALELMLNRHSLNNEEQKDTCVFLFSWPSDGAMMKNKAYLSDRNDARDSSIAVARGFLKLRDFLMTLRPTHKDPSIKECGQQLHLLCHSMGNYVLQHALVSLDKLNNQKRFPQLFQHIFMCAPDVDDNIFEEDRPMVNLYRLAKQVTVYYNNGDLAMYISDYTKGNTDRLGHNGTARPSQLHNKVSQVNCSKIVGGITEHSYYLWATVNEDIRQSIDGVPYEDSTRNRQSKSAQVWRLT